MHVSLYLHNTLTNGDIFSTVPPQRKIKVALTKKPSFQRRGLIKMPHISVQNIRPILTAKSYRKLCSDSIQSSEKNCFRATVSTANLSLKLTGTEPESPQGEIV